MGFWSTEGAEPKRKYRWTIRFTALGGLSYALKKADKPKGKVNPTTHKYLNHNFNYPGRFEWEDINLTFASVAQPDATYLINKVLINAGYHVPKSDGAASATTVGQIVGSNQALSTIGKRKFGTALGTSFELIQLNPEGKEIEVWKVVNPFFTSVNFGDLDYSSEDIVDIQVGVKYDWAQLTTPAAGIQTDDDTTAGTPSYP
jgi:predicted porin